MVDIQLIEFLKLIELNVGSAPLSTVAIVDMNFKIWAIKGKLDDAITLIEKYEKNSLVNMKVGEEMHNDNSFLMKVTDNLFVLATVKNPILLRIAIENLRGRINALSTLFVLDKLVNQQQYPATNLST